MRGKFSFITIDIWFDLTNCKFNVKNISSKMLVALSPIFVADTLLLKLLFHFVFPKFNAVELFGDN